MKIEKDVDTIHFTIQTESIFFFYRAKKNQMTVLSKQLKERYTNSQIHLYTFSHKYKKTYTQIHICNFIQHTKHINAHLYYRIVKLF